MSAAAPTHLLDANVLMALWWPHHVHHVAAHRWFALHVSGQWATCAITQSAFVRISLQQAIHGVKTSYSQVVQQLERGLLHPAHVCWSEAPAFAELPATRQMLVQGYKQVTDAYLLALTQHHGGKLATFDTGIPTLLPTAGERRRWVEVIPP